MEPVHYSFQHEREKGVLVVAVTFKVVLIYRDVQRAVVHNNGAEKLDESSGKSEVVAVRRVY